jgi:dipeptidyl aminopeptidase/acylaminoacyl peptidase
MWGLKYKKNVKIVLASITLFLLGIATYFIFIQKDNSLNSEEDESQDRYFVNKPLNNESENSEDESAPFQELTIPYLRGRKYDNKLGDLDFLSEQADYSSYITSYSSDGYKINGLITIPDGEEPEEGWPAIVFVHGYIPPANYRTTGNYAAYVDYLARNGFVVFKIDLRGHGESEGIPGGAYYSGDYIIDTLSAYRALQSADFIDSNNIGLWGHSMGGNVVFRSFVAKQDIKAVSIWAGAVYTYEDFQEYGIDDNSYVPPSSDSERRRRRNELFDTHGSFDPEDEFWSMVVPTNYLDGVSGAVQLNHSVDDNVVSIEYTRNLSSILMDTGIMYEVNEYSSGGHNISGSAFNEAMGDTVDFFETFLKE